MNDFAKSAAALDAPRQPIRTTIREHWSDVESALDHGVSYKAIAAQLKVKLGTRVGSVSGFNSALNFVIAEKGYVRPTKPPHAPLPIATPSIVDVSPVVDKRRRMWGDDA
jgi:hypothetical protein